MITAITRGEIAALIPSLPPGDLRAWCELSAAGPQGGTVYADASMVARCRATADAVADDDETDPELEAEDDDADVR